MGGAIELSRRGLICTAFAGLSACLMGCDGVAREEAVSAAPGARAVSNFPTGTIVWQVDAVESSSETDAAESLPVATAHSANTSNLVCTDDTVYVGAGWSVCSLDRETGAFVARGTEGNAYSPLVRSLTFAQRSGEGDEGLVLAARADGTLTAHGAGDLAQRWSVACASGEHVVGRRESLQEDGSWDVAYSYAPTKWQATDIVVHDGFVYAGFSSYATDEPRSRLVCANLDTGELAWTVPYNGCFSFTGGACHPALAADGLVVPVPEEPAVALLDYATGEELARCALDAPAGTGFTTVPEGVPGAGGLLVLSQAGTLHALDVHEGALDVRASSAVAAAGSTVRDEGATGDAAALPSCARPVVVGGTALVNQAVPEGGEWHLIAVDLETFEARDTNTAFAFGSTPVVLSAPEEEGVALVTVASDGLWRLGVSADGSKIGSTVLLTDEVTLTTPAVDMPPVVDEAGRLYIASGTSEVQSVFCIA